MVNNVVRIVATVLIAVALAACGKGGENKIELATKPVATPAEQGQYKGWKDYVFAGGKFVLKYPTDKAISPAPTCYASRISGCNFNTEKSGLRLSWGPIDRAPAVFTNLIIEGEKARGKLRELHDIKVNGFDGKEFVIAAGKDGDMRFRLVVAGDTYAMIFGFNLRSKFSESKEEIDKFVESLSPVALAGRSVPATAVKIAP